ncbi:hypothetical protein ACP70R_041209 [Stipagrostis hirtigluma subsp. patula]
MRGCCGGGLVYIMIILFVVFFGHLALLAQFVRIYPRLELEEGAT